MSKLNNRDFVIRPKLGVAANLSSLNGVLVEGELALTSDTHSLYAGNASNNPVLVGLSASVEDQLISGGANVTSKSLSTGNITVDCGARPLQYITNGGAFTITAPAADGSCKLLVSNNASAGAITFSGFSVPASPGDPLTTTNGHKFTINIWRINGTSGYRIAAMQ
jgi:hypothetical protein